LNSANLIVIGAGDGATLGLLWLASESARYEADSPWPESRFVAAAYWLDLMPNLAGRRAPVYSWLRDAGSGRGGVRLHLLHGADNRLAAEDVRTTLRRAGRAGVGAAVAIPGAKLAGQRLLTEPATVPLLVDAVEAVMRQPNVRPWSARRTQLKSYFWRFAAKQVLAKTAGGMFLSPVPLDRFGVR
jgi:hypothetical protein